LKEKAKEKVVENTQTDQLDGELGVDLYWRMRRIRHLEEQVDVLYRSARALGTEEPDFAGISAIAGQFEREG
jgi:TPP-dependent pyruvate/acetoin dehydrogenase alpha subunit